MNNKVFGIFILYNNYMDKLGLFITFGSIVGTCTLCGFIINTILHENSDITNKQLNINDKERYKQTMYTVTAISSVSFGIFMATIASNK